MYTCNTYNFGHRTRFSVTLELPPDPVDYRGLDLWGSVCYWIEAKSVGDLAYGTYLGSDVRYMLSDVVNRMSFGCSQEIFTAETDILLHTILTDTYQEYDIEKYGGTLKPNYFGFIGSDDFWKSFEISLDLDIMEEDVFCFEYDGQARMITVEFNEDKDKWTILGEHFLPAGEVQPILQETLNWLNTRFEIEHARINSLTKSEKI